MAACPSLATQAARRNHVEFGRFEEPESARVPGNPEPVTPHPTPVDRLKPLALVVALGMGFGAGTARAQAVLDVGAAGVIGDTVLTTPSGTANVPAAGVNWSTDGGTGAPASSTLVSPAAVVPATGNVTPTFTHRYDFEDGWDGGAVFVSVNGAPAAYLAGAAFSSNGYIGDTTANGSAAWAGGEDVFYQQSAGYATPALITSVADLGSLNAGDTVSVRFVGEWD